jgi:hypothetical protein
MTAGLFAAPMLGQDTIGEAARDIVEHDVLGAALRFEGIEELLCGIRSISQWASRRTFDDAAVAALASRLLRNELASGRWLLFWASSMICNATAGNSSERP